MASGARAGCGVQTVEMIEPAAGQGAQDNTAMAVGQAAQPGAVPSGQGACVWHSGQAEPWCDGCIDGSMGAANGAAGQRYRAAINRVMKKARIGTMTRRILRRRPGAKGLGRHIFASTLFMAVEACADPRGDFCGLPHLR